MISNIKNKNNKAKKTHSFEKKHMGRILIFGIALVAIGMVTLFTKIDDEIKVIDKAWVELNVLRSEKVTELVRLQSSIGFNGVIHHYKNYILRQTPDIKAILYSKLGAAEEALNTLEVLSVSDDEIAILENIEETIKQYRNATDVIGVYIEQGLSISEIDELVKIDDSEAIEGLNYLQQNWSVNEVVSKERTLLLRNLVSEIGYGGMIHNFKNYMLRNSIETYDAGLLHLHNAQNILNQYSEIRLNQNERASIATIYYLLTSYEDAFSRVAKLSATDVSIAEIDRNVRVDDSQAVLALENLQREMHKQRLDEALSVSRSIQGGKAASSLGLLIALLSLSVLLFVAIYITREWNISKQKSELYASKLLAINSRINALVATAAMGIITINSKGVIESYNNAAKLMFGYTEKEIIGANISILMNKNDSGNHDQYLKNYIAGQGAKIIGIERIVLGRRKDGTTFPMDLTITEMVIDGEVHFTGMFRDISEAKKIEEQLFQAQKLQAVGQLTGGLAHDFNNILAVISGNSELLGSFVTRLEDPRLDKAIDLNSEILLAANKGAELTKSLLAFSSKQPLSPVRIELSKVFENIKPLIKRSLGEEVAVLGLDFEKSDCWDAECDMAQLESAIMNIVINAKQAMLNGGVIKFTCENVVFTETYSTEHSEIKEGEYVKLSIEDNGQGMSKEVLKLVCEPFFTTKSLADNNSGLGLSMVYGFVKQSGGGLVIESEEGSGTTVNLYIHRSYDDDDIDNQNQRSSQFNLKDKTILLVEDDKAVRKTAKGILEREGVNVIEAEDGADALIKFYDNTTIDVVVTDMIMPGGMSGKDLAEQLVKVNKDVKVIFMSGYAGGTINNNIILPEDDILLAKPFTSAQLYQAINNILNE